MKLLYYMSYALSAPFFVLSWVLYILAWVLNWLGDAVHDHTTFPIWNVLHKRRCSKQAENRATSSSIKGRPET